MATEAMIGYLSKYLISDPDEGSPGDGFFEIGEIIEINPGEETADRVDVTHMQSPNRQREFIAGFIDPGEASFTINWVPGGSTDTFLRALRDSGEERSHKIEFPNGASVTYKGRILAIAKTVPIDDRMTATITVARSGGETWDDGGSPGSP
jgi:hypothetical protein